MVREVISSAVKRGKLECRASLKLADTSSSGINANALTNVLALQQEVLKLTPTATPMSVYDILQMPPHTPDKIGMLPTFRKYVDGI